MEPLKNQAGLVCYLVSNHSPSPGFNPVTGDSSSVTPKRDGHVRMGLCTSAHLIPAKVAFSRRKKAGDCAKKAPFQLRGHERSGQECSLMFHSPNLPRNLWQQNKYTTHHPSSYQVILWLREVSTPKEPPANKLQIKSHQQKLPSYSNQALKKPKSTGQWKKNKQRR